MTTQVPNEGSDMTIYKVGHELKNKVSILEAYDMITESVVCKLMWILGQTGDPDKIKRLFYTTVSNDILY
jgi:L-asparaginase